MITQLKLHYRYMLPMDKAAVLIHRRFSDTSCSRSISCRTSYQHPPLKAAIQYNKKRALQTNPKKGAPEENTSNVNNGGLQRKKRVMVQNLTNVFYDNSYRNCCNASKIQVEKGHPCKNTSRSSDVVNVDDHKHPRLCCPDIYKNLRAEELARRPYPNFMETIQKDITQSMRGILVDWLVEVSERYKLGSDTLYLAAYLIDLFLSKNYIETHRLLLIGITCMLISSKYEEICAPHVEEFCFIAGRTYTREEVLKMEIQVLKHFNFQLFAPTSKTFLGRFLRAAQVSYKSPSLELDYLANYLTELTLVEYSFLHFLPSIIAASAIFLSRWTLDPTSHPWNPTLEYYTTYKSLDLKLTVTALQDLQLNTKGCPLIAIRTKYRQQKFKSVAALSSQKLPEMLFS